MTELRDFINFIISEWSYGWMEKILVILSVLAVLIIACLICWGIYLAVDSWFVAQRQEIARVVGRDHVSSHTQLIPISTGSGMSLTTIFHPEKWCLLLEMKDGRISDIPTDNFGYNTTKVGTKFKVNYKSGRLSGSIYITAWQQI